jgi:hypothetical protein
MTLTAWQMYMNQNPGRKKEKDFPIPGLFASRAVAEKAAVGRGFEGDTATILPVPIFCQLDEFERWEKENDPEYREYLRLREKFEEG